MEIKNQFVSYDIAIMLKQFGFSEPCLGFYYEDLVDEPFKKQFELSPPSNHNDLNHKVGYISAPLYQQVIDFLRVHEIQVIELPKKKYHGASSIRPHTNAWAIAEDGKYNGAYGRALAIKKALEKLEKQKNEKSI